MLTPSAPPLVLHVIHHLVTGGMENGLVNLINRMPPTAFGHAIACIEDANEFRQRIRRSDVPVFELRRSQVGAQAVRRQLYTLCRTLKPTIVHSRNQSGLDALLPAWLAGVRCRIHGEHGWDVDNLDGSKFKPALLKRLHTPLVSRYVTVSKDLQRYLQTRVGVRASRISQIYNGVDVNHFVPRMPGGSGMLPAGFADGRHLVVGTVGRLQAVKQQAALLAAVALAVQLQPQLRDVLRVVVVGDGPLREELAQRVHALGLQGIALLPGASHDVRGWLQSLDLFVLPSLNEGISNTILEAMACGLPVLASAVGGNVELIDEGNSGALFAPNDVAALADHIIRYAQDRSLRERHGQLARCQACERFSLDTMVQAYLQLYQQQLPRAQQSAITAGAQS